MDASRHVYYSVDSVEKKPRGIALGIFDGFHLGHQALIAALRGVCQKNNLRTGVFTFSFPDGVSFGGRAIRHTELMTDQERIRALFAFGVDDIFMIPFSDRMVRLLPTSFLNDVIMDQLSADVFAIGEDARFGYRGEGDAAFLRRFAAEHALLPVIVPDVLFEGTKISSTRIRALLSAGDVGRAASMMTRPFRMVCRVRSVSFPKKALGAKGEPERKSSVLSERDVVFTFNYPDRSVVLNRGTYSVRLFFDMQCSGKRDLTVSARRDDKEAACIFRSGEVFSDPLSPDRLSSGMDAVAHLTYASTKNGLPAFSISVHVPYKTLAQLSAAAADSPGGFFDSFFPEGRQVVIEIHERQ